MFPNTVAFATLAFVTVFGSFGKISSEEVETTTSKNQNEAPAPASVDSRFFDLGGIINQLFSGFNQGNRPRPGGNPGEIDSPGNSQFYPGAAIQNNPPPMPPIQYPIIDDAKHYPNQGHLGGFQPGNLANYPNPGNYDGFPQSQYPYTGGGNLGYSQGGMGYQQPQNPDQEGGYGGYPYQDQQNFGMQSTPYPGWGNPDYQPPPYPNNNYGSFPSTSYPSQNINGPSIPYPAGSDYGEASPYPDEDGLGVSPLPPKYPGNWGGAQDYPSQGGYDKPWVGGINQDLHYIAPDMRVPEESSESKTTTPKIPDVLPNEPDRPANAILGKPVLVPQTTTPAGQIVFPDSNSAESPAQKQCVQDCQSSTEYNPVCGTNNVTYINPSKFVCARNCGIHVFVKLQGKCPDRGILDSKSMETLY